MFSPKSLEDKMPKFSEPKPRKEDFSAETIEKITRNLTVVDKNDNTIANVVYKEVLGTPYDVALRQWRDREEDWWTEHFDALLKEHRHDFNYDQPFGNSTTWDFDPATGTIYLSAEFDDCAAVTIEDLEALLGFLRDQRS